MTDQSQSIEEISRDFYAAAVKLRAVQLREKNPTLTKQQAIARAYREIPEAYEAERAAEQAKQAKTS